jgi:hypothetical protein
MAKAATKTAEPKAFRAEPTLSRGQKAAATRKLNAAKKAADHAKKVKAIKISTAAKVPSAKERARNLSKLAKEQKARDQRKAQLAAARAKHEAGKVQAETDKRTKGVAAIRKAGQGALGVLRHTAVLAATKGKRSAYDYAAGLNASFTPDWPNFKPEDGKKDTNHGKMVAAFFTEKKAYYEDFRANFDGVGECNPSAYWANIKKYAQNLIANGVQKKRGQGSAITAEQALRRDLPALYLRANNAEGFEGNDKLQAAAKHLGEAIVLMGLSLGPINEKIGK